MARGPCLRTARLELRPLARADLDAVHALWTDPQVRRFLWDGAVIPRERAAAEIAASRTAFETEGFGLWGLLEDGRGPLLGFCGLRRSGDPPEVELLYALHPGHWGRGLAGEAARAVLWYGFEELGLPRITAAADAPNAASLRLLERLGMRRAADGPLPRYALAREDFAAGEPPAQLLGPGAGQAPARRRRP